MSIKVTKQALAALARASDWIDPENIEFCRCPVCEAKNALRQAIAEAEQAQPVGEVLNERGDVDWISFVPTSGTSLYTNPPQRKPLTDEEIKELWDNQIFHITDLHLAKDFVRDVEAAHGIKENT